MEMHRNECNACFWKFQDLEHKTVVIPHECDLGCDFTDDEISFLHDILIEKPMIEEEIFDIFVGRATSVWVAL